MKNMNTRKLFLCAIALAVMLATVSVASATDIYVPDNYTTIQAAIDAASPDDTIIVRDGEYPEDLIINTANLTLRSENGSDVTTIQLVDGVGIDIQGAASNFTLGGAEGKGFTIMSGEVGTTFDIQLANAPSGVEIFYNTIYTTGQASMGVSVGAAGATGLIISDNTFTGDDGPDGSIWGPNVVDVTVIKKEKWVKKFVPAAEKKPK